MARLSKDALLDRVYSAVTLSGWRSILERTAHPFEALCLLDDERLKILVYIWNLTPGGPSSIRPEGEFRIQLTGISPPLEIRPSTQTLLLGWSEEQQVFAAFNPYHHQQFSTQSPSIQVRLDTLEEAAQNGFGFQLREARQGQEVVVAFSPEMFMEYVLKQYSLHRFLTYPEVEVLQDAAHGKEISQERLRYVPGERSEVVTTITRKSRDRNFRLRVLHAYRHRCVICHIQLELVQAAHIIPVGIPESTDETANGLALCVLHHQAYDRSLLAVAEDYRVQVNDEKLKQLRLSGLANGEEALRSYASDVIYLPKQEGDRPKPHYLSRGMAIRGWPSNP